MTFPKIILAYILYLQCHFGNELCYLQNIEKKNLNFHFFFKQNDLYLYRIILLGNLIFVGLVHNCWIFLKDAIFL